MMYVSLGFHINLNVLKITIIKLYSEKKILLKDNISQLYLTSVIKYTLQF